MSSIERFLLMRTSDVSFYVDSAELERYSSCFRATGDGVYLSNSVDSVAELKACVQLADIHPSVFDAPPQSVFPLVEAAVMLSLVALSTYTVGVLSDA